jgi:hypothetical protein
MPGKRKEYDGNYAVFEVGFVLGDSRLDFVTDAGWRLYSTLWCLAVKERRETLPRYHYPVSAKTKSGYRCTHLARRSRMDGRKIPAAIHNLVANLLIKLHPDGRITVKGVRDKHPNLKWKDKRITKVIALEKKTNKKKKKKKKKKEEYVGGLEHIRIEKKYYNKLRSAYPHINHQKELEKADAWIGGNPKRIKKNWHRFINNWFNRAEEQAPKSNQPPIPHVDDIDV